MGDDRMNYYLIGFILLVIVWMVYKQITDKNKDYSIPILIASLFGVGTLAHKIFSAKEDSAKNQGKLERLAKEKKKADKRIGDIEKEIEKKNKEIEHIEKTKEGTVRDIIEKEKRVEKLEKDLEGLRKRNDELIKEVGDDVEGDEIKTDDDIVNYINDNFSD
jgi:septal ring factor EnvC (AmiA/AmiB activator)